MHRKVSLREQDRWASSSEPFLEKRNEIARLFVSALQRISLGACRKGAESTSVQIMSDERQQLLVCAPWPGLNRHIEIRKASCSRCKTHVAVSACNLPQLHEEKIGIICTECYSKMQGTGEKLEVVGINLPKSGQWRPMGE